MRWSQEADGSHVAGDDDLLFVISRVEIPYPDWAPPGLKFLCGWFWQLQTFENGQLLQSGPPRKFDKLDDARRAVGRRLGEGDSDDDD
jgi:hypothetical protein